MLSWQLSVDTIFNCLMMLFEMIAEQQLLPPEYKDYKLIGNYSGCRECHITPDWLLIYELVMKNLFCIWQEPEHTAIYFRLLKTRQKIALSILLSNNIEIVYVVKVNICWYAVNSTVIWILPHITSDWRFIYHSAFQMEMPLFLRFCDWADSHKRLLRNTHPI